MQQLYEISGRGGEVARMLDLVALGIVADVATQQHDTRYLLQRGIALLRQPERVGLRALIQSANLDPRQLSAEHIGFQIGPRLNALGRLDDATQAVDLLTTNDEQHAAILANILDRLNERRKLIGDQIYAAAQEMITSEPSLLEFEAIVLSHPHWHPGVVGIVASRLAELYECPVVLLVAPEGEAARGSARSVPGVDIGAAFAANADLLFTHGGHAGAAGCTLDPDLIPQFRRRLSNTIRETRDYSVQLGLSIDAMVSLGDLDIPLANELDRLAPFGEGNPPVCLVAPEVGVVEHVGFGSNQRHRRVTVADGQGTRRELIWWDGSEKPLPGGAIDLALTLRVQDYRGAPHLALEWLDSRPSASALKVIVARREVVDMRNVDDPAAALRALLQEDSDARVWAEGEEDSGEIAWQPRYQLGLAAHLVIWTAPPGTLELEDALGRVMPARVTLFAHHTPPHTPEGFLRRLLGLAQYAIRHYGGVVSVERLAGATGQRVLTVRKGLEWLAAKGSLAAPDWLDDEQVSLAEGDSPDAEALEALQEALRALLMETYAYRVYFQRASLDALGLSISSGQPPM
jgi:single-stranded-DNA-specific exonuclease